LTRTGFAPSEFSFCAGFGSDFETRMMVQFVTHLGCGTALRTLFREKINQENTHSVVLGFDLYLDSGCVPCLGRT
jgi:hypothetical protein